MKGLFMRYLYVKYQHPIPNSSKDIAQVKVFSWRRRRRHRGHDNSSPDSRPGELKRTRPVEPVAQNFTRPDLNITRPDYGLPEY